MIGTLIKLVVFGALLAGGQHSSATNPSSIDSGLKVHAQEARDAIQSLQSTLFSFLSLNEEEIQKTKEDYQVYYKQVVVPRLRDVAKHVKESAIHWVDIDFDGSQELVFWTEGVAPSAWGAHEYIFVVGVEDGSPQIIQALKLDGVSRGAETYKHVRFWSEPNKNTGYNDALRAVLSYGAFGASGSTFKTIQLGWNRYENKLSISSFDSQFPMSIDISSNK